MHKHSIYRGILGAGALAIVVITALAPTQERQIVPAHGSVVFPMSRVYRVFQSNPQNPNFPLAAAAVRIDGASSYYTWNELSRNIPAAVQQRLPPGFDYSPWVPDGQIASGGRVDPMQFPRTYAGLDQVSGDWPKTDVTAGETITVDFLATAAHNPSAWDVWMTRPSWNPSQPLTWAQMEFLGRPNVSFSNNHFTFPLQIPGDRTGHHVIWVAWQRDDPVGEVFFSTSDVRVCPAGSITVVGPGCGPATLSATGTPNIGGSVLLDVTNTQGTISALWIGLTANPSVLCSGCTLGTDPTFPLPVPALLSIPNEVSLIGANLYAQGADIGGTTGGCRIGAIDLTLTETVRLEVGR